MSKQTLLPTRFTGVSGREKSGQKHYSKDARSEKFLEPIKELSWQIQDALPMSRRKTGKGILYVHHRKATQSENEDKNVRFIKRQTKG